MVSPGEIGRTTMTRNNQPKDMIGVLVGQYECLRLLGEGGTGAVYYATHRVLGTPRAVKVLFPQWTRYPEMVERFVNEARAAAAIRHRNIIGVHDCGRLTTGQWFILYDYFEGGTLTRFIESHGGPMALHDVLHVIAETANGVQAAHDHGIVHRDLKPDNLYLSHRDGDPRYVTVLDFGVAKLGDDLGGAITGPGAVVGTPAYMAPEQLRGGPISAAVDVFALGVMTYQMVTGGWLPFQIERNTRDYCRLSAVELYQRIMAWRPIDPASRGAHLPPAWTDVILAALDPSPTKRPASPRAFALALAEATAGDGFLPSGLSTVRAYARELLEIGAVGETVRGVRAHAESAAPDDSAQDQVTVRTRRRGDDCDDDHDGHDDHDHDHDEASDGQVAMFVEVEREARWPLAAKRGAAAHATDGAEGYHQALGEPFSAAWPPTNPRPPLRR
jgi:serine/threonine protein kinase